MIFRLNPECYLVKGAKRSAIYDLIEGRVYSLDEEKSARLSYCEMNNPVTKDDFLLKLEEMGLGTFYERPIYIEKYRNWSSAELLTIWHPAPVLHLAQLQITNRCNLNCPFCGKRWCPECTKLDVTSEELSVSKWKEIITQLSYLKCQNVIFTGGEATLYEGFEEIITFSKGRGLNTFVVTNGLEIPEFIKNENVILNLLPTTHQKYQKIFENVKSINNLVINSYANIPDTFKNLGKPIYRKIFDFSPITKENLLACRIEDFNLRLHYDVGLFGRLTITSSGILIPCFELFQPLGDLKKEKLGDCIPKLIDYWEINKDKTECKICEFRYACPVCLPRTEKRCNYIPQEGRWI